MLISRLRMYHQSVKSLAHRVLEDIRQQHLLSAGQRIGIAVSGGLDSVGLLRLMIELRSEIGAVVSVVHLNHQLRGADSESDEQFVAELAKQHNLEFHFDRNDVRAHAGEKHLSLEAAARHARYQFFERLLRKNVLDRVATAHTLDDQAETVILRLARGTGTRGLAGIYPLLQIAPDKTIVRPLLTIRRKDLKAYLEQLAQEWREDKSNRDLRHSRNRVRHGILPRMEQHLNPSVREALADTAEIARGEEEYWSKEVARLQGSVQKSDRIVNLHELTKLPLALQRRLLRKTCEDLGLRLEFNHVEEILRVLSGALISAQVATQCLVVRKGHELHFQTPHPAPADYEYPLPISVATPVPEAHLLLEAVLIQNGEKSSAACRLNPAVLQAGLTIRNWRAGDRFWPAHAKSPKKVKELLQQHHVTGPERQCWPVVVSGPDVVWLRGFAGSAQFLMKDPDKPALSIREKAL